MGWGFISEYVEGTVTNSYPDPGFGKQSNQVFKLFTVRHIVEFVGEATGFYHANENDITAWEVLIGFAVWGIDMALGIQ